MDGSACIIEVWVRVGGLQPLLAVACAQVAPTLAQDLRRPSLAGCDSLGSTSVLRRLHLEELRMLAGIVPLGLLAEGGAQPVGTGWSYRRRLVPRSLEECSRGDHSAVLAEVGLQLADQVLLARSVGVQLAIGFVGSGDRSRLVGVLLAVRVQA